MTAFTRIDTETRKDLVWWSEHIQPWDGWQFMNVGEWQSMADCTVTTDACNTGQGGTNGTTLEWFAALWSQADLAKAWVEERISMP